jgi:putative ABC transport system permease protein
VTRHTELSFRLPAWLLAGNAVAIIFICGLSSVFSLWKVLKLEPAIVFKG